MKKYRLIKTYPGSLKLGNILEIDSTQETGYYSENTEFWEEIIEPDYEILSFKQNSGITDLWTKFYPNSWGRNLNGQCATTPYTTEEILANKLYAIHSVKRLSDGEVFTVGDTIKTHKWGSDNIINSITIANGSNSLKGGVWLNCEGGGQHFSHSIKVIKKDYEVTQVSYATEIRTLYDGEYRLYHDGVGFDLNYILKNSGSIHSVKRLSDGEVFTVGDRIKLMYGQTQKIEKLYLDRANEISVYTDKANYFSLNYIKAKVVEKDYEIVSYVNKYRPTCTTTKKRGGLRHDEFWKINSVKRLSDGEIFKVGDTIDFDGLGDGKLLEIEFEIAPADKGTGRLCFVNDNRRLGKWFSINQLNKVKEPIFITHDGVSVFKSDTIWLLHKKTNTVSPYIIRIENDLSGYICFSKKEKLNEYMLRHKPCLSLDDIQRAIHLSPMLWDKLLEAAKAKLNYEQDKTN